MREYMKKCRKRFRGSVIFIFAVIILTLTGPLPSEASETDISVQDQTENDSPQEAISYTALGDSIPNGYHAQPDTVLINYPTLIARDLGRLGKRETELSNYAKNGLTTVKLNEVVLKDEQVIQSIRKADLITVTIGANDLMNQFKKTAQEILDNRQKFYNVDSALKALQDGISDNPLLLVKVVGALGGWDYASFEEQWTQMITVINDYKKDDCQVVVTTIYNPVGKMELPGTLNAVVENVIGEMNDIIVDSADEYGYVTADLYHSDIGDHTQSDGLHPDQTGQNMVKELVESQLDIEQITGPIIDEQAKKEAADTAAKAKAAKEKQEKNKAAADIRKFLAAAGINLLFLCMLLYLYRRGKNRIGRKRNLLDR